MTEAEVIQQFSSIVRQIGSVKLDVLLSDDGSELFIQNVKESLMNAGVRSTRNSLEIVKLIARAYLRINGITPDDALTKRSVSTPKKRGIVSKVQRNMQQKSIPIEKYREIYAKLDKRSDGISNALLFMLFLGLSAEEVCGLNAGDIENIQGYSPAMHIRIEREYKLIGKAYTLVPLENEKKYRYIPLPKVLSRRLTSGKKADETLFSKGGRPLRPDKLVAELEKLISSVPEFLSITDNIISKKEKGKLPRSLSISQEIKLFDMIVNKAYRDSLMFGVAIMFFLGLRPGEVCGLKFENIHPLAGHEDVLCALTMLLTRLFRKADVAVPVKKETQSIKIIKKVNNENNTP